jgi:hypothetical protein
MAGSRVVMARNDAVKATIMPGVCAGAPRNAWRALSLTAKASIAYGTSKSDAWHMPCSLPFDDRLVISKAVSPPV